LFEKSKFIAFAMTATNFVDLTPLKIITYVFSFVQRLIFCQYQRALSLARSFINNCLDIPVNSGDDLSLPSNFLKKLSASVSSKSETSQLPISQDECEETPIISENSKCESYEVAGTFENEETAEQSENHVSFNIKEIGHGAEQKRPKKGQASRVVSEPKSKVYMAGTRVGLDEYNEVNREYFYKKYYSGMEVDDYSFVHSSAKLVDSKSLFIAGAYLWKSSKLRVSKRKAPMFKPTELSTIFENLAY